MVTRARGGILCLVHGCVVSATRGTQCKCSICVLNVENGTAFASASVNCGDVLPGRRFHRILIYDEDCYPEMEAAMEVPPEMNRIGMPLHDTGVPAHDAHFRVIGLRSS